MNQPPEVMHPVIWLIVNVISIYIWIVILSVVLNLLIHFNVVNRYQPFVQQINLILIRLTEPVYARIRKVVPSISGIDLSPLILLIGLQFLQRMIIYYLA